MPSATEQLEAAITALEAQRALLGDAVVDASVNALRARLAALDPAPDATPASAQTLRQVSILFLDVVGSTTLAQRLDPEAVSAVMDDALARGTTIVQSHGGKVLQYAGDNILAAFGAEESREDDTERAVRCGLVLLELGKVVGAEVGKAHAHADFDFRVGIHTGGVLLGGGIDADGTIRGSAVNIAARMEQTAPAGALRITHDTYTQVRGLFEVEAQAPLAVKGVAEPVQSYLVKSAKPRSFRIRSRGIEGVATRMIGRDAEFESLQDAFARLFAERGLSAVTVVADAGIGKSRLLYEFEAWAETRPEKFLLFRGRANPQTQGQPFGLLRDILAWRLQIADDDSIETARRKMEDGIVPLFLDDDGADAAEGHAHLLGHLIGIEWRDSRHIRGILDDPKQIRNRAFHAAAQMFRRVSAEDGHPIVVELEDLHWADNESLDFLTYLGEVDRDVPMLLLAFSRPTLFERRADWQGVGAKHQRIDLRPLDKTGSRMLANELLKRLPEVPAALRELVTGGAEGNPFYMEELVKMLIDQGAIDTLGGGESGQWTLHADKLMATQVPGTLTGVLQARLDGLPAPEKIALQEASVIGQVFWDQALFSLDAKAKDALPALVGRELALPRADAGQDMGGGDDLREYAFRHQILHQVTYDTLLRRRRRELHGEVAQWLTQLTGLRASDFLGATAEHYERAGDTANAAEFHARAAEHARERFGHDAVLAHVGQALALLAPDPDPAVDAELRWRLLRVREQTLELQARRAEQVADIEALEQLAEILDDDQRRAYAAWRRGHRAMRMADWAACESAARRLIDFATPAGEHGLRLHALRLLSVSRAMQGDLEAGSAFAHQGLSEARERGLRMNEAFLLNALAIVANLHGDVVGTLEMTRQNLLIYRELGDRQNEAVSLSNLGAAWLNLGDLAQAQRDSDEALRMLRANGDRVVEGVTLGRLSNVALWRGDDARALALARAQLDSAVATQARDREVHALLWLAEVELALARHDAAGDAFVQAREKALAIASPWHHDATAGLARVALRRGDAPAALREIETLLIQLEGVDTLEGMNEPRLIELTCWRVLAGASGGTDPRADDWLARAHEAVQAQAATITDPGLRRGFLHAIPHHREIIAAWAAQPRASARGDNGTTTPT